MEQTLSCPIFTLHQYPPSEKILMFENRKIPESVSVKKLLSTVKHLIYSRFIDTSESLFESELFRFSCQKLAEYANKVEKSKPNIDTQSQYTIGEIRDILKELEIYIDYNIPNFRFISIRKIVINLAKRI